MPSIRRCVRRQYRFGFSTDQSSGLRDETLRRTTTLDRAGTFTPSPGTPGEGRGEGSFSNFKLPRSPAEPSPTPLPAYRERVWRSWPCTSALLLLTSVTSMSVVHSVVDV